MIKYNDYYFHGTDGFLGSFCSDKNLLRIYKSGKIIPSHQLVSFYTGMDEICLCDPSKQRIKIDNNYLKRGFDLFIKCGPALAIKKENLDVITPKFAAYHPDFFHTTTDLYDEVRYNGVIPTSKVEFVTFPIINYNQINEVRCNPYNGFVSNDNLKNLEIYKYEIEQMKKHFKNVPLINLFTGQYIDITHIDKLISVFSKQ